MVVIGLTVLATIPTAPKPDHLLPSLPVSGTAMVASVHGSNSSECYPYNIYSISSFFFVPQLTLACPLTCQNGGTHNTRSCTCDCADGYSGFNCGSESENGQ